MELERGTVELYFRQAFGQMLGVADRLGDQGVNDRPHGPKTNAVGALIVHCCAVTEFWIGHVALGRPSTRDRESEFSATATVAELRRVVDATVTQVIDDLAAIDEGRVQPDRTGRQFLEGGDESDGAIVLHVLEELYQHLGHMELAADALAIRTLTMDFEVNRADVRESRVVEQEPPALDAGQALLRIDAFALTANNITYAMMGDALGYWGFFPSSEPEVWGHIPVWGFADVVATTHDDVPPGTRVYGFLPMSTHLVVTPGGVAPNRFVDVAPHRTALPGAYNSYSRTEADPAHDPAHEDHRMVLWPLFFTSFLIDDFLDDNAFFGAAEVVLSSASSKTAIGTAFQLEPRPGIRIVGLTSPGNVAFVEQLGVYDRVVPYDEVDALGETPAAYVDIAGDAALRSGLHRAYGDRLTHSMMVGATHWDEPPAPPADLPGPTPSFFFAPDQILKRTKDWGRTGLDDRVALAWRRFVEFADEWLDIRRSFGPEAVAATYRELADGRTDPAVGHVLSLWPDGS